MQTQQRCSKFVFKRIKKAFRGCCAYCGATGQMTRDHVLATAEGGKNGYTNILPACSNCNLAKGNMNVIGFILTGGFDLKSIIRRFHRAIIMSKQFSFGSIYFEQHNSNFIKWKKLLDNISNTLEFVIEQ